MNWMLRHRWASVLAAMVLFVGSAGGLVRLSFDPSYATFFDPDDPDLVDYQRVRNDFDASDSLLLILDPAEDLFSEAGFAELEDLQSRAWQLPFATRVDSAANWQHVIADGDEVHIVDLATLARRRGGEAVKRIALAEPLLTGRLVSADGEVAAVVVTVRQRRHDLASAQAIVMSARELAHAFEAEHPGARVYVSGIVAMNYAFAEASEWDTAVLVPGLFVLATLMLALLLRSWVVGGAVLLLGMGSALAAMGIAGWAGLVLTSPTVMAPIVIVTLSIAQGVHVVRARMMSDDWPGAVASVRSPLLLTAVTTVIGMLTFNASEVPPFRDLGNLIALGVTLSTAANLVLLPIALHAFTPRPWRGERVLVEWLSGAAVRRPAILSAALLLTGLAALGWLRLEPNDRFVEYFSERLDFRRAADFQNAHLSGLYDIEFEAVPAGGDINDPAYLHDLDALLGWLRAQREVRHASGWTDLLRNVQRAVDPEGPFPPQDREVAAQDKLIYELSLPVGQDLANLVCPDDRATRVLAVFGNLSTQEMLALERRIVAWAAKHAPALELRYGSINLMFSHIGARNIRAMMVATAIAMLAIALLLGVYLGSFRLGLVSFVVNALPIGWAFGLWGLAGQDVSLSLSTSVAMTFGIVVDDTVHLLWWYRRARRAGNSVTRAWRDALEHAGVAVFVTSVALAAGFGLLATSSFALNADLATIALVIVLLALAVDLVLLPALFRHPRRAGKDEFAVA